MILVPALKDSSCKDHISSTLGLLSVLWHVKVYSVPLTTGLGGHCKMTFSGQTRRRRKKVKIVHVNSYARLSAIKHLFECGWQFNREKNTRKKNPG